MTLKQKTTNTLIYEVKLSESQLEVVNRCLDLVSRLGMGQFDKIFDLPGYQGKEDAVAPLPNLHSKDGFAILGGPEIQMRPLLDALHVGMTGLHPNAYHKIRHPEIPAFYRKAYDLHQVIRKRLAENAGHTGWNVDLNDFMRSESDEPIAVVKRIEE
jgi:hypothetical protein